MIVLAEKSIQVEKTNTLHQFDHLNIVGVDLTIGRVPILFYVKERPGGGRRGIIFGGDSYQDLCFMYPEVEHSKWCTTSYDLKYDKIEEKYSPEKEETSWDRNHGIFQLDISNKRRWYNGTVWHRAKKLLYAQNNNYSYPQIPGIAAASYTPIVNDVKNTTKKSRVLRSTAQCVPCGRRK